MTKRYHKVGLGGTFDRFHIGHQHFLEFCGSLADTILVGITVPELILHKKAAEIIEPLDVRIAAVRKFLKEKKIQAEVISLTDPYGPTLENSQVEAVAVTEQTVRGAEAINAKRVELQLSPLPIHVCELLRDSTGQLISSTRIRLGKINRHGEVYYELLKNGLTLTNKQAEFFHQPQGPVLLEIDPTSQTQKIVLVGDFVTDFFLKQHAMFSAAVFDRKNLRQAYTSEILESHLTNSKHLRLVNPASQLTPGVVQWVEQYCTELANAQNSTKNLEPIFLEINGEEDLVTVAFVLLAPLDTHIYYGQPHQGMVKLIVNEELKEKFKSVLFAPAAEVHTTQFQS